MTFPGELELAELEHDIQMIQIDGAKAVGEYESATEKYSKMLKDMAARYKTLMVDYVALKRACGETKGGDDGLKADVGLDSKLSNPYIAVLVDGNAVQFKEEFVRGNGNGGPKAAEHLENAVKKYAAGVPSIPKTNRIIARIYADLKELSNAVLLARITDQNNQSRNLAPFAANFTQTNALFDFIDVGTDDAKETKISEMLRIYAEDPQCVCVLVGVGASVRYLDMLAASKYKVVLIKTDALHAAYGQLGFDMVEFKDVFGSWPCPPSVNDGPQRHVSAELIPNRVRTRKVDARRSKLACWDFQRTGQCARTYCKFEHVRGGKTRNGHNNRGSAGGWRDDGGGFSGPRGNKEDTPEPTITGDLIDLW